MKKLTIIISLLALLAPNVLFAHATIGVFDLNRALFETEAWKQQVTGLEDELREETNSASDLSEELAELQESLQINAPTSTAIEIQRIREEMQFKQLQIQQIGENVQAALRNSQSSFLDRYRQLLGDAISEVYEEGSYDIILKADSIVMSGFTYDITSEVTAKLNEFIAELNQ